MKIIIKEHCISCIIGIYPEERITEQKLLINAQLEYQYNGEEYIDYTLLLQSIQSFLQEKKFELLEDAIQEMICMLSRQFPIISSKISLCKPSVTNGNGKVWVSLSSDDL